MLRCQPTELDLLSSILEHSATDPHDKVFSLYPILQLLDLELLPVDYDQPFSAPYEELKGCWICSRRHLGVILLAARLSNIDSDLSSTSRNLPIKLISTHNNSCF